MAQEIATGVIAVLTVVGCIALGIAAIEAARFFDASNEAAATAGGITIVVASLAAAWASTKVNA